ncbi:Imm40 family immunity protein [Cobetia crustatorum]|nr:Imm40 family immunity protein [Cobetia crustatorum]
MTHESAKGFLKVHGVSRTNVQGGEVGLDKAEAIEFLSILESAGVCVLGGDVYEVESDGYFRPTGDNWYCDRCELDEVTYTEKTIVKAREYIKGYVEKEGVDIKYVVVAEL